LVDVATVLLLVDELNVTKVAYVTLAKEEPVVTVSIASVVVVLDERVMLVVEEVVLDKLLALVDEVVLDVVMTVVVTPMVLLAAVFVYPGSKIRRTAGRERISPAKH
jgi:hypothetical protein